MERIQAAIAKARAARGSAEAPPRTVPTREGTAARATSVDRQRAEDWAALPAFRPDRDHLVRNRIVAAEGGPEATAFDVMRTRLLQQMRAKGWTRVAITSPTMSCGKSMIAANLAFSLTRQAEISTCLLEIDMRRPSLGRVFGLRERHAVSEVLSGMSHANDHAVRIGDNLMVMASHTAAANPSDMLQGGSVGRVLSEIEATYAPTIMMFDMPPLLVNDDTLAFLGHVDCALLVAAAGRTTIKEIDRCERELAAHTNVLGVVLNKCRYSTKENVEGYY